MALALFSSKMLAGRTPHVGSVYHAVLVDICTRDADDVRMLAPHVPEPIAKIIARALSRDRAARFPDAQSFLDALGPHASTQLSSGEARIQTAKTRVSSPAASTSTAAMHGSAGEPARARLGKVVAALLLLAIVGSAALMVVVHKRFKSQQAERNAALLQHTKAIEGARFARPQDSAQELVASAPNAGPVPPAAASASIAANRRNSADAGAGSRRAPPRASAGVADELQLKTTMP